MLARAETAVERIGTQIGEITDRSGARVSQKQVIDAINGVAGKYNSAAATRPVGRSIQSFGAELLDSLRLLAEDSTASVQDVLRERKAIDRLAFQDAATLDPKVALEAKRELRSRLEGIITDALDGASGKVPGELRAQYKALKRDYHGLRIIEDVLADSTARAEKASTFGLGEKIALATSAAAGNLSGGAMLAVGGKLLKERGAGAAAAALNRAADLGTFEAVLQRFNEKLGKSAAGVLREAPAAASTRQLTQGQAARRAEGAREAIAAKQEKARGVMTWVSEFRANPQRLLHQVQEAAELVGRSAGPAAAESYTASAMRAISFIAGHIPVKERRDPLDPSTIPPLSYEEADRLVRAATYALQPEKVFDDFEKGIVTPEGLRAAKTFMPESFLEFQLRLQEHVADHMSRNRKLTQSQRLRIDKLLGYPAGADLRPKAIAMLQANLAAPSPEAPSANPPTGKPVNMKTQQSGFDAIEARKAS
jgi:hypothetical protein